MIESLLDLELGTCILNVFVTPRACHKEELTTYLLFFCLPTPMTCLEPEVQVF